MKITSNCFAWLILPIILLLGQLLTACSTTPSTANAIETVLNKCARNSAYVNQSTMSASEAATYLADAMQATDTRDCPQVFRQAFQEHIMAWRQAAPYFANNTTLNVVMEGMVSGFTGDRSLLGETQRGAFQASQRINDTYQRLTSIAVQHGARVPVSVVNK